MVKDWVYGYGKGSDGLLYKGESISSTIMKERVENF